MPPLKTQVTREELGPDLAGRLGEAQVIVLPGFPNKSVAKLETGEDVYPSDTADLLKLLRESGVPVEYADRGLSCRRGRGWLPARTRRAIVEEGRQRHPLAPTFA
jgi:hypothetical protein